MTTIKELVTKVETDHKGKLEQLNSLQEEHKLVSQMFSECFLHFYYFVFVIKYIISEIMEKWISAIKQISDNRTKNLCIML